MDIIKNVSEVDWEHWVPRETAVLCFVRDADKVMLIHKKTGLGKGKINAPGGRIEKGESPYDAAIRETIEETGITPINPVQGAELSFIFTDGYSLHGTVFFADAFTGELTNTREADPFWCLSNDIPYTEMWEDDQYWVPLAMAGIYIKGYFIFDDDKMMSMRVEKINKKDQRF
ncbi:MAG: 8-oxo-dGTP diphosphatase [Fibrobacteria bacterium]|nr:8-oxo-dGTP diphosphatase [Fibrobacteria bacterium]